MSDKVLGVIGQKYEDRKTGKSGVLESRDEKYKTLMLRGDDGVSFSICNSTFRSNWRKVKEDVVETEPVETEPVEQEVVNSEVEQKETTEPTEETESVKNTETKDKQKKKRKAKSEKQESLPSKSYEGITDEDAIATLIESVMKVRKIEVFNEADCLSLAADDVIIANIRNNNNGTYNIAMLPDLFTLVDWRGKLNTLSIEYKTGADNYLGVIVDTKQSCIPEILDIIEETVKDINVYGYTTEESEEE